MVTLLNSTLRMLEEAERYPLHVRVGAKLYLEGWTETKLLSVSNKELAILLRSPVGHNAINIVRDLERGQLKMTPTLKHLANQI